MLTLTTRLFPIWALLGSALALVWPDPLVACKNAIVPLLAIIMLGMGLSLTWNEFREVFRTPKLLGIGMMLQFGIMPAAAYLIGTLLNLTPAELTGMVLVGASAGGTASNVICYLAGGRLALSVNLTLASTIAAIVLTPALTWLYLHQTVPVPAGAMLVSILKIVAAPVLVGTAINSALRSRLDSIRSVFPLLSVAAIVFIIAIIVALNRENLLHSGLLIFVAVILHNATGLGFGYGLSRLFRCDRITSRTIAIEVGMQNSGLSVTLALQYFSAAAALPGAIFSIWHNLSGSLLAAIWSGIGNPTETLPDR
ncbi:bile acid:sodium symporter family protein [Puniceicoccus vermicola]|uniref:Bile acid:sodium symporter family protein n=2 Tax=Puniceicoccus vermicola TaxID=388746 RepID=A0A7X1AUX9_9BACT|nr:bile acid:sodium symporter family protein [Puniceicoccus vermicola]